MRRWLVFALAGALACSALCAHAQTLEKPKITIAVGGKSLFYYLPLTIAERLGYFRDEGLSAEVIDFPGGAKALEAMVGGSADVVSGAYEHTISMQAKGVAIEELVVQGRYNGIVLALTKAKAPGYKSPKDLKGMKVGVTAPGSSTNYFVNTLLARDGLAPDAVSIIGVGAGAGAVAGMQRGDIDAISNLDPVITQLEMSGVVVPVVDTRTAQGMKQVYGDAYAAGSIYAPADFSRRYPKTAQAIANAMVRALRWIAKATPDQIVATVPPEYYGGNKALYETALKKNMEGFSPDGLNSMQAAENVYKVLKAFDPSVQKAQIDLAKTFNNTFVQQALKKYP